MSNTDKTYFIDEELIVRKTADVTITSDTDLTDDDDLFFEVEANQSYAIVVFPDFISEANADIKFLLTVPTNATFLWSAVISSTGTATAGTIVLNTTGDPTHNTLITIGRITVGDTSGTVNFQWAQNTTQVTNTTLFTNSWIWVKLMP